MPDIPRDAQASVPRTLRRRPRDGVRAARARPVHLSEWRRRSPTSQARAGRRRPAPAKPITGIGSIRWKAGGDQRRSIADAARYRVAWDLPPTARHTPADRAEARRFLNADALACRVAGDSRAPKAMIRTRRPLRCRARQHPIADFSPASRPANRASDRDGGDDRDRTACQPHHESSGDAGPQACASEKHDDGRAPPHADHIERQRPLPPPDLRAPPVPAWAWLQADHRRIMMVVMRVSGWA